MSGLPPDFEPRATCARCLRPASVCYCRHLRPVETRTRVVLLQHPRESDVAIGTARMAHLSLPNSELYVGIHFDGTEAMRRITSGVGGPPVLLYPGPGAIDVMQHPPPGPVTLVVVDGTWWQAKKIVRVNPGLAALPRYAFSPPSPSDYRIRPEPHEDYVSTVEALAHVLGALEGDRAKFRALLAPFRAMVDAQIENQARRGNSRPRRARPRPAAPKREGPLELLRGRPGDLVCAVGEANAWPYRSAERASHLADELVQWSLCRVATGEVLDLLAAPRHPLAPATPAHLELDAATIAAGGTLSGLLDASRGFLRESDVVCSWGYYATSLFAAAGGALPPAHVDLRQLARELTRGAVGTVEQLSERLGLAPRPLAAGRAGRRLGALVAFAELLVAG
ncbi:MAG TPA: tRNA-uridine aminocarboxypropyltransferase [Polyangiaceae bacterium]|nr:tRNA-uridine aminocarboxypropyltransferase [Polyangiaceae bacterium]